jgi:malate dehydrogenase
LVGAMPRREGMERKDLLAANVKIFKAQGMALDKVAKKTVKVLVVGNPANTNCLITSMYASSIPHSQFTCLTQLDQNRACGLIASRLKVAPNQVHDIIIWGNHSATQYPDVTHGYVENADGSKVPIAEAVQDDAYLKAEFVKAVQTRGAAVIRARKLSSAMSAAKAIGDHMRNWWCGTPGNDMVSMGVLTDGSYYGIKEGVVYSLPVRIANHQITVVKDLTVDDFSQKMMDATFDELWEEKEQALAVVQAD